jgi:hypothetical protein
LSGCGVAEERRKHLTHVGEGHLGQQKEDIEEEEFSNILGKTWI